MPTGLPATLLDLLQVRAERVRVLKDVPEENLTRYVPGQAVTEEDAGQQRRRGTGTWPGFTWPFEDWTSGWASGPAFGPSTKA